MRSFAAIITAAVVACACFAGGGVAARAPAGALYSIGYSSPRALAEAIRNRAQIVQRVAAVGVAEVRSSSPRFAEEARGAPGIRFVDPVVPRASNSDPALVTPPGLAAPFEWEYAAAHEDLVPQSVLRAAAGVTIAIIDTGVDVSAPDVAAKSPSTYNVFDGSSDVLDTNGHGTFVSSLAAGSVTNNEGIAGFGGDAKLLVVKASGEDGTLTDVDEVTGIVYAVNHGARVINLSVGGTQTSEIERRGIQYAFDHGALVVAAAGNEYDAGNPVEYPAALLQPVGSDGRGGLGLSVGASTVSGTRAFFSNTGSQLSLAAPGENVFSAVSSFAPTTDYPRVALPGSNAGSYGFASGTSFSTPEVAGVAALVFAANPLLRPAQVADILKETASGHGSWNPATGYGIVDAAAAVAQAQGEPTLSLNGTRLRGRLQLRWFSSSAAHYRVSVRIDRKPTRVVLDETTRTSATFAIRSHHRYLFVVTGYDASGAAVSSASYSVRG
jgi:subtilisin family serine protease